MSESFDEFMERKRARLAGEKKPAKKRTGLKPVSKKQSVKLRLYKQARDHHYSSEENRCCAICGTTDNLSIHHTGKRGNEIANKEKFITLCIIGDCLEQQYPKLNGGSGGCHGFVEANKEWAREKGDLE
jgi:hypothetical protein